eukprot:TRINITY_DN15942_c0_g1_i4.p1 TRINITY_DN15942_c0_g1~~TRINITY_DN15942_c0_g1_i4.p1  ORF type:complete len:249 (+),score=-34.03 TRINITY_DN15942_c0_g1_i4:735-1481(+)
MIKAVPKQQLNLVEYHYKNIQKCILQITPIIQPYFTYKRTHYQIFFQSIIIFAILKKIFNTYQNTLHTIIFKTNVYNIFYNKMVNGQIFIEKLQQGTSNNKQMQKFQQKSNKFRLIISSINITYIRFRISAFILNIQSFYLILYFYFLLNTNFQGTTHIIYWQLFVTHSKLKIQKLSNILGINLKYLYNLLFNFSSVYTYQDCKHSQCIIIIMVHIQLKQDYLKYYLQINSANSSNTEPDYIKYKQKG